MDIETNDLNPSITDDQIRALREQALKSGDKYTVLAANRALKGDETDRLACAMCL